MGRLTFWISLAETKGWDHMAQLWS